MFQNCGVQAKTLLQSDGCDMVLVIWDLTPPQSACLGGDRDAVFGALDAAGLPKNAPVYTICISAELEAWLLADHYALSAYLSTAAHEVAGRRRQLRRREKLMNLEYWK